MRFNVPKFIDVEDKIFGPLTFKQFVYLVGGAGLCVVVLWASPSTLISLPGIVIIVSFSLALAFFDYNGKPFLYTVRAVFNYLTNARTYVWKRREHEQKDQQQLRRELEQIEEIMEDKDSDTIGKKSVDVTVGVDQKSHNTKVTNQQ
jgi:hypothetical protein